MIHKFNHLFGNEGGFLMPNYTINGKEKVMEKTMMSVAELSMQMGISLPKAYELVKQPGFPTIRVGTQEGSPTR